MILCTHRFWDISSIFTVQMHTTGIFPMDGTWLACSTTQSLCSPSASKVLSAQRQVKLDLNDPCMQTLKDTINIKK